MKRLFILASAAIVALAACTKTGVVYNEAPQEIGLKAVTGMMTKTTDFGTQDLGVFADVTDGDVYFGNTLFSKSGDTWTADKYWPIQNTLDFTVYAPHVGEATYSDNVLTIPVADNSTVQTDWLYGASRYMSKSKDGGNISTTLNHGLSKITVKVWADVANVYTITSLILNEAHQAGTLEVTYDEDGDFQSISPEVVADSPVTYSHDFVENSVSVPGTANTNAATLSSYYVFPSDVTSFTVTYNVAGGANGLQATVYLDSDLNDTADNTDDDEVDIWESGKHYTYVLGFTANQICFNKPTISGWDVEDDTPLSVL